MAKGYWVSVYREINNAEKLGAYAAVAGPAIAALGGRPLARGGKVTAFEDGVNERVVIVEFDSYDQALAAHDSDGYKAALEILKGGAVRDFRVVEGV